MPALASATVERRALSALLIEPHHLKSLSIHADTFFSSKNKTAFKLIKSYVDRYKKSPTVKTLKIFIDKEKDAEKIDELLDGLDVIKKLPTVKEKEVDFYLEEADNLRIGREIAKTAELIKDKFEGGEKDYMNVLQDVMKKLLTISTDKDGGVTRGMIHENVKDRYDIFAKKLGTDDKGEVIPFGMSALDSIVGGMRKTFVTLLYSKTGGGKTRTAINMAYNAAMAGFSVIYFSLEMSFNLLSSCFDSRMAMVDSRNIIFSKMSKSEIKKYKQALRKQYEDKLDVYVVDISIGNTSSKIMEEIELYQMTQGKTPDLAIIDYANIMRPQAVYSGRSEQYDKLFQEIHNIAKFYNVSILTATQESREASKGDIEAKQHKIQIEQGVHNIGLSNFMAPHCETVIRLKQDSADRAQNKLWAIIDKSRYGNIGEAIPLTALWDITYVGDRSSNLRIKKNPKNGLYDG